MIKILHLYPKQLNTYGDNGNILALKRRMEWRGIACQVIKHHPNDKLSEEIDIIFGGGGQDSNQKQVEEDVKANAAQLKAMIENNTPALFICGSYQLIGSYFQTIDGDKIEGAKLLDFYTESGKTRLIGNIIIESEQFGSIVGYENHSGQSFIGQYQALGKVIKGFGNNQKDAHEGILYKNTICTYLHGPILPKNPQVCDFLIAAALKKQGINQPLSPLDDSVEWAAHHQAKSL